jgi:hypothetical protein
METDSMITDTTMRRPETLLWTISLVVQLLLVLGALSLSWIFPAKDSNQFVSDQGPVVEERRTTEKDGCASDWDKNPATTFLVQANRANREALGYCRKAIENFALAMLIVTAIQLAVFWRIVRQKREGYPQPSAE